VATLMGAPRGSYAAWDVPGKEAQFVAASVETVGEYGRDHPEERSPRSNGTFILSNFWSS